jgi:exodeoxyribonuclease VII small subunit
MRRKETPAPMAGSPEDAPSFESMMERLEALVSRLENGNLSLEESIRSFEEGVGLVKRCTAVLAEAEQRIERLSRDASKAPRTEPLETKEEPPTGPDDELPF